MALEAPLAILVCGNLKAEKYKGFWVQDCSAATMNILLAAHDRGLGAVWVGIYPTEERVNGIRNLLKLPDHIVPLSLILLSYSAEENLPLKRFDSSLIYYNHYRKKNKTNVSIIILTTILAGLFKFNAFCVSKS